MSHLKWLQFDTDADKRVAFGRPFYSKQITVKQKQNKSNQPNKRYWIFISCHWNSVSATYCIVAVDKKKERNTLQDFPAQTTYISVI